MHSLAEWAKSFGPGAKSLGAKTSRPEAKSLGASGSRPEALAPDTSYLRQEFQSEEPNRAWDIITQGGLPTTIRSCTLVRNLWTPYVRAIV